MSARLQEKNMGEDWKQKYFQSQNDIEREKKAWKNEENNLYKSILRLVLSYAGAKPDLDKQFDQMRDALRKDADGLKRKQIISEVIEQTLKVAGEKKSTPKSGEDYDQLIELLKQLDLSGEEKKERDKLVGSLSKNDKNGDPAEAHKKVALIINRAFISKAVEERNKQKPDKVEIRENDIFDELLQRLSFPGELGAEILQLKSRARDIDEEQERLALVDELVTLLSQAYIQNTAHADGQEAMDFSGLKECLFQLIEWLPFPDIYQKKIDDIKTKLSGLDSEGELKKTFKRIAELVNDLQSSLQDELIAIEKFLRNITERLQELDEHINNIVISEEENRDITESLRCSVQDNIDVIRNDMEETDDLQNVKQMISKRLMTIEQNMTSFLQAENSRKSTNIIEIERLKKYVEELKEETKLLQKRIEEERNKAHVDALTRIPNRLAFDERMMQEFKRWQRHDHPLSICVVDIDKFKQVNDTYGHKAGDKVLVTVAELCASRIRETDFFARYGGEEFVLLLPETALDEALTVAENLRKEVDKCSFHYAKEPVNITISCGLGEVRKGDTIEDVFNRADSALYLAKNSGRNQCKTQDD